MTGTPTPATTTATARSGRRRFLQVLAGCSVAVAGCTGNQSNGPGDAADVIVGPGGRAVFEPATVEVSVGETITWYFESASHNVSCRPGDADGVELPPDAEPFASYGPDENPLTLVAQGETYEHVIGTPGDYRYVCVPHVRQGMIGEIRAEP